MIQKSIIQNTDNSEFYSVDYHEYLEPRKKLLLELLEIIYKEQWTIREVESPAHLAEEPFRVFNEYTCFLRKDAKKNQPHLAVSLDTMLWFTDKEKCLDFMSDNEFDKNYEIVQGTAVIKAVNEYGIFLIF